MREFTIPLASHPAIKRMRMRQILYRLRFAECLTSKPRMMKPQNDLEK